MKTSEGAKDIMRVALARARPELSFLQRKYITEQICRELAERGYIIHHYTKLDTRYEQNNQQRDRRHEGPAVDTKTDDT